MMVATKNSQLLFRLRTLMVRSGDLITIDADPSQGMSNGDILNRLRDLGIGFEGNEGEMDEPEEAEDDE